MKLEARALQVEVCDTGIGIPEHERERIFEEFVQLESSDSRKYEGTGLGLAMVRSCVALLSGKLTLDAAEGNVTRFRLMLPELTLEAVRSDESATRPQLPSRVSAIEQLESAPLPVIIDSARAGQEVLVVDDNAVNLEVMAELLKSAGYLVLTCSSGREALERMAVQRPDLMLLDLMMPELSGEEVLTCVRADPQLRDLPVILLTARASREDRLLGLRLGADDYLAKPVDSGELLLRVRNTLERAHLAQEKAERDQHVLAARAVQEALLPIERSFPGVTVEDHYHAAEQLGGDWFGYGLDAERRRLYVALGDATGHGVPAALVSGAAAGAFRAALTVLCAQELSCSDALLVLTRALHETVRQTGARAQRMMTMALVCLDLDTGRGSFVNAGHGPLLRFGTGGRELLQAGGPVLGSEGNLPHVPVPFELTRGDALFVYSDGLIENTGPDGRALSPRKLHKLLEHDVSDLALLKRLVLREAQAIWREHTPDDDTCFVLLRWQGLEA
jgi:serine phosphatase RsbU (regulator of sigma subunit)